MHVYICNRINFKTYDRRIIEQQMKLNIMTMTMTMTTLFFLNTAYK